MDNPTTYLSTAAGFWTVIHGGSPLCAATTYQRACDVARQFKFDPNTLPVWNGDSGSFLPA